MATKRPAKKRAPRKLSEVRKTYLRQKEVVTSLMPEALEDLRVCGMLEDMALVTGAYRRWCTRWRGKDDSDRFVLILKAVDARQGACERKTKNAARRRNSEVA